MNNKENGIGFQRFPYLSVANVKDGYLDLTEVKTMSVSPAEVYRRLLAAGDVLFTEGGDADKLGRGCLWRGEINPCLHQNHVFAVRPHDPLRPEFLAAYRDSPRGKQYFLSAAKQTTNLASINATQLKAMPIPLPSVDEQQAIMKTPGALGEALQHHKDTWEGLRCLKGVLAGALLSGAVRVGG